MFKNYDEITNPDNEITEEFASTPELKEPIEPDIQEPDIQEPEMESELVMGVVTNCLRLNVREKPTMEGSIITEVDALSELMIDLGESNEGWYRVCTEAGIEGFCMKKFIAIKQ